MLIQKREEPFLLVDLVPYFPSHLWFRLFIWLGRTWRVMLLRGRHSHSRMDSCSVNLPEFGRRPSHYQISRGKPIPCVLIKKQDTFTKLGAWIGIKRKTDSRLYWVDDALVEGHYSAWYSGQPDNSWGREGCGHMLGTHRGLGGTWNDLPCFLPSVHYNPVVLCQKPSSFNDVLAQW